MEVILRVLKSLRKPCIGVTLLGFILLLTLLYAPSSALAFSGGSMGGSDWSSSSDNDSGWSDDDDERLSKGTKALVEFCAGLFWIVVMICVAACGTPVRKSVIKLQVCLFGTERSLQRELDRIAETTDTSTPDGWKHVLKETISCLLQHQASCVSFHSSMELTETSNEAEKLFNRLLIEEREKFDRETLSNVNGVKTKIAIREEENEVSNEYIVVTILVAVKREQTLPSPVNNSRTNLRRVLNMLGSIPTPMTKAVRVLWAPQDENETLSEMEVRENYPLLVDLPRCKKTESVSNAIRKKGKRSLGAIPSS